MGMQRILVVEDNHDLAFGLRNNLEIEGYEVAVAHEGTAALTQAEQFGPDLIVLDLSIPDPDGFRVLRTLRDRGDDVPVMILSAAGEETSKVRGLRIGADDFVTKPFSILELLARIEALLRRPRPSRLPAPEPNGRVERFGNVVVDLDSRTVTKNGKLCNLTPRGFQLLAALLRRKGSVVTRAELLREVWGHRTEIESRTVDTHIADIRREIEDDPTKPRHLVTVWKTGYRLQD
jgi:DNA-binding response OmpR family regulator